MLDVTLRIRKAAGAALLTTIAVALPASAATDVRESTSAVLNVSPEHVLAVLSSNEMCGEGCRYEGPHIVREVKLKHKATEDSFFKWTHVGGVKTVKFFKHFRVKRGAMMRIEVRTLTEASDAALIAELEKKTGLAHEPAFDVSTATYVISPQGEGVKVQVDAMTRVSGVMTVFAKMVRTEMKRSLEAMFRNFAK